MRVLMGEKVPAVVIAAHDPFAFRVQDGYQSRCKCGWAGPVQEGASRSALEKARRAANADGSKHDAEEYR